MSEPLLGWPLRKQLREEVDGEALARVRRRLLDGGAPRRRVSVGLVAFGAALVLSSLALLALVVRSRGAGELLTSDGRSFAALDGGRTGARRSFEDGSWLAAGAGASVRGLASNAHEFSVLLERGALEVRVTPGGPRRWSVEAGVARIEVVGTHFVLERGASELSVRVREGSVLVRSARLPDGVQRLNAGQHLRVPVTVEAPPKTQGPSPAQPSVPPEPEAAAGSVQAPPTQVPLSPVPDLPRDPPLSAKELLNRTDEARARGDAAEAEGWLSRLLARHPDDPSAPLANYHLGLVQLQQGRASAAKATFEALLARRPPSSLWQDALLHLVELERARGDFERAAGWAAEYRARFPSGRHLSRIEALVGEGE